MSAKIWASVLSCVVILGVGSVTALGIHLSAEQQLDRGPLLAAAAVAAAEPADNVQTTQQVQPKTRKEIIESTQKRVVTIESGDSLGSGFLYNSEGDLLTNAHVVEGSTEVIVRTLNHEEYPGTVIGIGVDTDIAVVRVPKLKGMVPLTLSRTLQAETGDEILALGSPLGFENTVTTGIVSGVDRNFEIEPYIYSNMIQISAPITHGNSGGPLVDAVTGEVLGINSAAVNQESGIGFSIPISSVLTQVEEWSRNPLEIVYGSGNYTSSSDNTAIDDYDDSYNDDYDDDYDDSYDDDYDYYYEEGTDGDYDQSYSPAEEVILEFYDSLDRLDYETAYSLMGSDWQNGTSFEEFCKGYLNTEHVSVITVGSVEEDDTDAHVIATIEAEELRSSGTVYQQYEVGYILGIEDGEFKILSGTGEKIER